MSRRKRHPIEFPTEAWTVKGADCNGAFWLSRWTIGGCDTFPLTDEQIKRSREEEVAKKNSHGWSVRLVRERLGDDKLWHEVEP